MKPLIALPIPVLFVLLISRYAAPPAEPIVDYTISGTVSADGGAGQPVGGQSLPDSSSMLTLHFNVAGGPGSSSPIDISSSPLPGEVVNNQMEIAALTGLDGLVTVAGNLAAGISGNVSRPGGAPVPGIHVDLSGQSTGSQVTDNSGNYAFSGLDTGFDYTVTPSWPGDCQSPCLNVYDLYLISQHILGVAPLTSPYALISADVNNSASVTSLDMINLQSVILGNTSAFPNNLCWRFVPADYVFPIPFNPWAQPWPEVVNINNLTDDVLADFIGIQVGDVSECAEAVQAATVTVMVEDVQTCPGGALPIVVPVRVENFTDITAMQLAVRWDPAVLAYQGVANFGLPGLALANFGTPLPGEGELAMAWLATATIPQTVPDGSLLFNLILNVTGPAGSQSPVAIADTPLPGQVVDGAGQVAAINGQNGLVTIGGAPIALGPVYCADGQQFISFYSEGAVSGADGDNVFADYGNDGWIVYELPDNGFYLIESAAGGCLTFESSIVGACADALIPDCQQPIALSPDVAPDGSLQIWGSKVVWVSDADGDNDIYAYDLSTGVLTNVSNNAADDNTPHLYGNRIAWRGDEDGDYEIWAYDCMTQERWQVSDNTTDVDHSPQVYNNYVAWRSNQDGDNEIYLYDLVNGTQINISNDNATGAGSPAVFGDWVVWESTDDGPDVDVFLYTISTQSKQNLSNSAGDESGLRLRADKAIWATTADFGLTYDLSVYDLSASTLIPLAAGLDMNPFEIDVQGDYAVWAARQGGNIEIFAYNLPAGPVVQLTNSSDDNSRPAIHAGQVVWEASEGGAREIGYYNLGTGQSGILGTSPTADLFPDNYGPFAVWMSDRSGDGQYELYFYNTHLLPPPAAPLDGNASITAGLCPGDAATLVLELAGAGLEAVWFEDDQMVTELYASADNLFQPAINGATVLYGAWRNPLTGCAGPLTAVALDASASDNLACNDNIIVALGPQCQAMLQPDAVLEGALGCLTAADFILSVDDGEPGNGAVVDGGGGWTYTVALAPGLTANFSSCFGTVLAQDVFAPLIDCPFDLTVQASAGQSEAPAAWPDPAVLDNCLATLAGDHASGDLFPVGSTTVMYTATDASGNQAGCDFLVTVLAPPADIILTVGSVIIDVGETACIPVTVENLLDITGMLFSISYDPAVVQIIGISSFGLPGMDVSNFAFPASGVITFAWNDENFTGQSLPDGAVLFEICFEGLMPGVSPVSITDQPTAIEFADASFNVVPVTINNGSATVNAPLVLDCPADIVQAVDAGLCVAFVNIPVPTLPGPGVLTNDYTGIDDASAQYPVGVTTVVYTYTGPNDTLSCTFTVTILDIIPPTAVCPPSFQVNGDAAAGGAPVILPDPTVTDNCPQVSWVYSQSSGALFPCGETTVICTATDSSGNQAECTFTVTVDCDCLGLGLAVSQAPPTDSSACCWNLDYSNAGSETVYGLALTPLDGVQLSSVSAAPGYGTPNTGLYNTLITPNGFGPMPPSVPDVADICLGHVLATPQYVVVGYLDANYEPFCTDTLVFNCPPERSCLYIVNDSLVCDTNGYKYIVTVTNPPGADFPVGYIKLNPTPAIPGAFLLPGPGIILSDTLYQGDTTMLMWNIITADDLFGDSLCFVLSAHDGPEERLCCAEIDTCIAFPNCEPCSYVDAGVGVAPLPGTGGDCPAGNPLQEPWLQSIIASCAERPCGLMVYCCQFQGQPVINVQDDVALCTDPGGAVYDYAGNLLFFYGGIGGINLGLAEQLEECTLIFDCNQLGDCCYSLFLDNQHPASGYFTSIQTVILQAGVTFSAIDYELLSGWSYNPSLPGQNSYNWVHNSGSIPLLSDYHLFDFCIEGSTTTDSISIEIQWMRGDSAICRDTVKVYCPECLAITDDSIACNPDGSYTYTFSGQNWSGYGVNAVGFVETSTDFDIVEDEIGLPFLVPDHGAAFGPLAITIVPTGSAAGDTLCFDIVLRQLVGDSIDILCCYATHCIVLPPCDSITPCLDLICLAPPDVVLDCSSLPPFDPNTPSDLQPLFGIAEAIGDCPGLSWQELPPVVMLSDCAGGTIGRSFVAFDAAGNPSTNLCTQTVTLQAGPLNYGIRFPADTSVDCAGLDALAIDIQGGACDMIAVTFSDEELPVSGNECRKLARTWRVINWCEYDGASAPVVVGRDEDCDGFSGEEDIWVLVRPGGLSYYDQDGDETNGSPAAGAKGTGCDGLTNPAGYWVDSGIKPAIASVGHWVYNQVIDVTEDCTPPTGLICNSVLAGILQPLLPPADVDGDGDLDDASLTLIPGDFLVGPALDDCSPPVVYSINLVGQAASQSQSNIVLTCDQVGFVNLEIHAWDAVGNHDLCQVQLLLQDQQGLCLPPLVTEDVRLQPNPASGQLLVRSNREGECTLEILGPEGPLRRSQEVFFRAAAVAQLNLEGLAPGLYLLRLRYADGQVVVCRFVKM